MEFLRKLPLLLRQHYEKLILALALAALALSGFLLAGQKEKEEKGLEEYLQNFKGAKVWAYTNVAWAPYLEALKQATNPVQVNFKKPRLHNLFGPIKWQKRPDGTLLKIELGNEVGPEALKVTKIVPLNLIINLDKVTGASNFFISVTREAHTHALLRKKLPPAYISITPGSNKDRWGTFALKEIKGALEAPELVLELADTGDKVSLFKDRPYQRVDGYKADFSYPPENKAFVEKRLNDTLTLGGEDYIIIAISPSEVVLSARSNNKRTTLRYNAAL
ncbi:MAG: hypothetical protein NTW03_12055 [Verrucomicrobia bacterium]|nr:hypothetical protein [Verrucomicrobiota bacterium]